MTIPKAEWDVEKVSLISIQRVKIGKDAYEYIPMFVHDGEKRLYAATMLCKDPVDLIFKYEELVEQMKSLQKDLKELWELPRHMRPNKAQRESYVESYIHLGCPNWPNCDTEGCGDD